jgi:hypothetical protein
MAALGGRPPELAEIFELHAPPLEQLGRDRRRVVQDVMLCRTRALGGHLQVCDRCGYTKPFYNSCRNRHCPKCQSLEQTRWVEGQAARLLPTPYFHVVFTVPKALHPFFLVDRRQAYSLLFGSAIGALHAVCQRRLGATPGTIAVLHTWTQTLAFHPHIHCIVTGGGLDASRKRWRASRPRFLVPVRVLSRVFRAKLLESFECAIHSGSAGIGAPLARPLLRQAAAKEWVVYSKAPMAGPEQVLRYLGRYTHRIAIGHERLVSAQDGKVTFRYRDRRARDRRRVMTMDGPEFVRRFLLHVLPRGFVRIRHFGLFANACRAQRIAQARDILDAPGASPQKPKSPREPWRDMLRRLTGRDPLACPYCEGGALRIVSRPILSDRAARGP